VHFGPLTTGRLVSGDFGTYTVRFAPLTNENRTSGDLCTLPCSPSMLPLTFLGEREP